MSRPIIRQDKAGLSLLLFIVSLSTLFPAKAVAEDLEQEFASPPASARPWVNWFWLDGNVTREGITADLEAMQRVGIGGALLMDVTQDIPPGPVRFGTPQWREMFKHTMKEAQRLGLEISMNNAPGWSGSGGPWITPEAAMQKVVWSKTNIAGPARFEQVLPPLPMLLNCCHDIVTLAFPTLVGDGAPVPGFNPKVSTSSSGGFDAGKLLDGDPATFLVLPQASPRQSQYIQLEFAEPFIATHLKLTGAEPDQTFAGVLQVSNDGRRFRDVREVLNRHADVTIEFEQLSARYFRILFTRSASRSGTLKFSELELWPTFRIDLAQAKAGLGRSTQDPAAIPSVPAFAIIRPDAIVDLTGKVDGRGRLAWEVPNGQWTVLRFGYTPLGTQNHPVAAEGLGLECDKLSKDAVEKHFEGFLGRLLADTRETKGAFTATHIDSWENGYQNWTPRFREEFRTRRGYDPAPYLPTFTGRIVGGVEVSERFLWDVRRTIADLWADNYAGHLAELSHRAGLRLSIEGYANGPFDNLTYAGRADVPMGEFWADPENKLRFHTSRSMASAAHTYGKSIVAAEAFTAYPREAKWQNHPFTLKPLGDAAFCEGINRLVIHRYAHQPWVELKPGMTMGQWGVHYERTETWWEQSKAWHEYLARCQFLLQRGLFVADICYMTDEGAFTEPPTPDKLRPAPPAGYDYDIASPEVVRRMTLEDGQLKLPGGMGYRLLVLPETNTMTPDLLRHLHKLVEAGGTVIGTPPSKSPGLSGYPGCDREVEQLARELWGDCDGRTNLQHRVGKGSVIWGKPLNQVLAETDSLPDFEARQAGPGDRLRAIHRRTGEDDFYFVANSNLQPVSAECVFRAAGRQPELWHPETGKISRPAIWRETAGRTILPLSFDPAGSVFVVFRQRAKIDPVASFKRDGVADSSTVVEFNAGGDLEFAATKPGLFEAKTAAGRDLRAEVAELPKPVEIPGPWEVRFPPKWGAPERVEFGKLISWTEHADPGVRYFSGTASYARTVQIGPGSAAADLRWYLELGKVEVIAEVKLNGKDLGILWKPPFRVEVTGVLKPGENTLEIRVVNLWPNRLIGDEQLPEDCEWQPARGEYGSPLKEWPSWLLEGKPRPSGRFTFSTWKHWAKGSPLSESGLLGPVRLTVERTVRLK